jgi:hypothetical protein
MLIDTYCKFYNQSEHLGVDKVIVLFEGGAFFRQYIPMKHKHFGMKVYNFVIWLATFTIQAYIWERTN